MTYAFTWTSQKHYTARPAARYRAARLAWDMLQEDGEIESLRLLDGLWMCVRPNGELDHVDASYVRSKRRDNIG